MLGRAHWRCDTHKKQSRYCFALLVSITAVGPEQRRLPGGRTSETIGSPAALLQKGITAPHAMRLKCAMRVATLLCLLTACRAASVKGVPPPADADSSSSSDSSMRTSRDSLHKVTKGRAPSCNGCQRREAVLSKTMRLEGYWHIVASLGPVNTALVASSLVVCLVLTARVFLSRSALETLFYVTLYLVASPTAILVNKILMKDYGFGYPVLVSALGQSCTAVGAWVAVRFFGVSIESGLRVDRSSMLLLGGASALALVLGQYPYLYLTVAFIQMLKAFSPAYMVIFLFALGVERPSRPVIACVLGLSVFTAIASAGEVNFNLVGVLFMASASCSDAMRLVIAQKLVRRRRRRCHRRRCCRCCCCRRRRCCCCCCCCCAYCHHLRDLLAHAGPFALPHAAAESEARPDRDALLHLADLLAVDAAGGGAHRAADSVSRGRHPPGARTPVRLLRVGLRGLLRQPDVVPASEADLFDDAEDADDGAQWRPRHRLSDRDGRDHHIARGSRLHRVRARLRICACCTGWARF